MNKEQKPEDVTLEEQVEAFQELRKGNYKNVEACRLGRTTWQHCPGPCWTIHEDTILRQKPTPKLRPWKPDEVPVGAMCKRKDGQFKGMIIACDTESGRIWMISSHTPEAVLKDFMHSLDRGKTWLPCGVVEE